MATTSTPAMLETELTPELLERLQKLSPESRDRLIVYLGGSPPIPGPPPSATGRTGRKRSNAGLRPSNAER